jgi:hypothetical protein
MMLRSQTTCERADNPAARADVTSGNMEDIGGEVCTRGGVTLTAAVDGGVCSMEGETRLAMPKRSGFLGDCHASSRTTPLTGTSFFTLYTISELL